MYDIAIHDIADVDITDDDILTSIIQGVQMAKNVNRYLPLSESTYYILQALITPLHGYGVMQKIEEMSSGSVIVGPGTLYGAFNTLEKTGLVSMIGQEERRKIYQITTKGRTVLLEQFRRLEVMVEIGEKTLKTLKNGLERR